MDGYGSKIRKVSRWRPTALNETILTSMDKCFFTKVAPAQSITDIVLLINAALLNVYFILHYHLLLRVDDDDDDDHGVGSTRANLSRKTKIKSTSNSHSLDNT